MIEDEGKRAPAALQPERGSIGTGSGPIRAVGLLQHPKLQDSLDLCEKMSVRLRDWGLDVYVSSTGEAEPEQEWIDKVDLLITLGGDGTILRAARLAFRTGTPILGVNLGRLGFLSELNPSEWEEKLPAVLEGNFWVERRMMLAAQLVRHDQIIGRFDALNDVVISRGAVARSIRVKTYIQDQFMTTYKADGVIIASPTGSTAYALAVGGPIMPPEMKSLLLIPIAPHLSMDRAIVLPADASVAVQVSTEYRAVLTVDGQGEVTLADGDTLAVTGGSRDSLFVRTHGRDYFYHSLMERLR